MFELNDECKIVKKTINDYRIKFLAATLLVWTERSATAELLFCLVIEQGLLIVPLMSYERDYFHNDVVVFSCD